MNVSLRPVTPERSEELGLRRLYEEAFPPEERRPWSELASLPDEFAMYAIVLDDGDVVGLAHLWRFPAMLYGEHLAIMPGRRGGGIGSLVVEALLREAGELPLVIEVEPVGSTPEAAGRIAFYRRCGLSDYPAYEYVQPPYAPGLAPVRLTLMATAGREVDLDDAARRLRESVYRQR